MENGKSLLTELLTKAAIAGNILFVIWILYNGINEGFQGTMIEKLSYIILIGLLVINSFLIIRNRRQ